MIIISLKPKRPLSTRKAFVIGKWAILAMGLLSAERIIYQEPRWTESRSQCGLSGAILKSSVKFLISQDSDHDWIPREYSRNGRIFSVVDRVPKWDDLHGCWSTYKELLSRIFRNLERAHELQMGLQTELRFLGAKEFGGNVNSVY